MERMRHFDTPDGTRWLVDVQLPSYSSAQLVFRSASGSPRHDRYAWINANGPKARDVTAKLASSDVLGSLSDADIARLFRRSMRISAADTPLVV